MIYLSRKCVSRKAEKKRCIVDIGEAHTTVSDSGTSSYVKAVAHPLKIGIEQALITVMQHQSKVVQPPTGRVGFVSAIVQHQN